MFSDSAEKNDSSEVSIDDDATAEAKSAEGGETAEDDSKEEETPSIEVAEEPYVPEASLEETGEESDDNETKEDATVEEKDGDSAEQQDEASKEVDGDSKEQASAEEETAEQGTFIYLLYDSLLPDVVQILLSSIMLIKRLNIIHKSII